MLQTRLLLKRQRSAAVIDLRLYVGTFKLTLKKECRMYGPTVGRSVKHN